MNTIEEVLNKLPTTIKWAPLVITKECNKWIIKYSLGMYDMLFVERLNLKEAAEEMLELIKRSNV